MSRSILRFRHTVALATIPLLIATPVRGESIVSTFNTGLQGWTTTGATQGPPTWQPTGGNPGGTIRVVDTLITGLIVYWQAPAAYLGNQFAAYGKSLSFDLRQTISGPVSQFDDTDVILEGAGLKLAYDFGPNPPVGVWTSYTVPLSELGWKVGSLAGEPATAEQMKLVLGSLTALRIRAEFQVGPDTDYLDNVVLQKSLLGDLNLDGIVDALDLAVFLGVFPSGSAVGDLNGDGATDQVDLATLLGQWGATD
jgi:hypothetical protein